MSIDVQIIEAPRRRRKADRYTEGQIDAFAEALPKLGENFAVKVGEADTENDARTIARDAQRELDVRHGLKSRTSVFKAGASWVAALRKKSGSSGGPATGVGTTSASDAPAGDGGAPGSEIATAPSAAGGTRLRVGA